MTTFEIMMQVENQSVQLERARAVLEEVEHYFDTNEGIKWLPHYADHILLLLHVADGLLYGMLPELTGAVNELHAYNKAEKEVKDVQDN